MNPIQKKSGSYNDVATKCAVGYFYGCVKHEEFVKVANDLLGIIEKTNIQSK